MCAPNYKGGGVVLGWAFGFETNDAAGWIKKAKVVFVSIDYGEARIAGGNMIKDSGDTHAVCHCLAYLQRVLFRGTEGQVVVTG